MIELVSNMNELRSGQLMDAMIKIDRESRILDLRKQIVLVERNPAHLDEVLNKMLPELCPRHTTITKNHHLPHYVVYDGKIDTYHNLDESEILGIYGRMKHPCSIGEKLPRKAAHFGRVSEGHNKYKLMMNDMIGLEIVVKKETDIPNVLRKVLNLPYLTLEHLENHKKSNKYTSTHANMKYNNGNPAMKGLEIEIQITDKESKYRSQHDPAQGHDSAYGREKLGSRRKFEGQLVIFGGENDTIQVPDWCEQRRVDGFLVAKVPNKLQSYTLVLPQIN